MNIILCASRALKRAGNTIAFIRILETVKKLSAVVLICALGFDIIKIIRNLGKAS